MPDFELTAKQKEARGLIASALQFIMLFGGSRCVAGDTVIDGQHKTIKEFAEAGLPIQIRTSRGIQIAEAPFLKGKCRLLKVTLRSGRKIEVTPDHRFWSGTKWVRAEELSIGSSLAVQLSSQNLQESNSESAPSMSLEGVRHSKRTLEDYLDDCLKYCRRYGQQLLQAITSAPAYCASLFCELAHTHANQSQTCRAFELHGLDSHARQQQKPAATNSRFDLSLFRLSNKDEPKEPYLADGLKGRDFLRISSRFQGLHSKRPLFLRLSLLLQSVLPQADNAIFRFCRFFGLSWDTPCIDGYEIDTVESITKTAEKEYYTLHAPVSEQYFANGILHHNSGKTFLAVYAIVMRAIKAPNSRHAILRFRFNAVKASIIFDTFPKVMRLCFPSIKWELSKSDWYVKFENGSEIWFGGLDDKERTEKILGQEYATIYLNESSQIPWSSVCIAMTRLAQNCMQVVNGQESPLQLRMLFDCNPPDRNHWTYKVFMQKVDPDTRLPLKDPHLYGSLQMNPGDNMDNLPPSYIQTLEGLPAHFRKRFLLGEFKDANPNALFNENSIDKWRIEDTADLPEFVRVVVGVDPSGADDDNNEGNDEIGIFVAALGTDGRGYLLEDCTVKAGPAVWGKHAVNAYSRHSADIMVGEQNFGGAMVKFVIKAADPNVNYRIVNASRGKVVRAEPFSPLFEDGRIRMVGRMPELEEELSGFGTNGYTGKKSPNRADAAFWALTELFPGMVRKQPSEALKNFVPVPQLSRWG